MRVLISAFITICALSAQTGAVQPPTAGFVFDRSSQALRRIQGIPGAALLGGSVDFGFPVASATVSPRMDTAIVLSADGTPHLFRVNATAPIEVQVAGLAAPDATVYSPSGTAAVLYAGGNVQVIRGLPDAPVLAAAVRVHYNAKSRKPAAESLAVSDDGAFLLLYAAGGAVELIGVAGDSRKLMDAPPGTLAVFAPSGRDVAVAHGGSLTVFRDVTGAATRRDLPGTSAASAMAFSNDGRTVFVASERGRMVNATNVDSGDVVAVSCDCAPVALIPMGSFFRLNELSDGPLWLLDASNPRLVFVPAKSDL